MKNSPEELKSEFIASFKLLLEKSSILKEQYAERVNLSIERISSFYTTLDDNSYNSPEVVESYLNDVAFSVLDLVLAGVV